MGLSYQPPGQPTVVPYMDLGGGLNTRLDPHALARNELAVSVNLWSSYDFAVAKRPGTVPMVGGGGVVNNNPGPCKSLLSCRFNQQTYLIYVGVNGAAFIAAAQREQPGATWRQIGGFNPQANFVTCAQMFDPASNSQTVFFCDGLSVPQKLTHPLTGSLSDVDTSPGNLPNKYNTGVNGPPITPQFVKTLGNNSHLFYAGESSMPSAVYISDPFYPQNFTTWAMQVDIDPSPGQYNPAIVGNNDGVEGGPISGMESLGSAMIIFKDAACYSMIMTTLLGEVPAWQVVEIDNATGCVAPLSIVRFSTLVCFLGIDGVYTTDGMTVTQISADVAPIFDATLTGFAPQLTLPILARAVRHGMRYELFYSTYLANYCNAGIWFDFTKQSRFGNPVAGMIDGMTPGGLVSLRGPNDTGNVAWGDALINRVGEFGVGYSDYGAPIATMMAGKADLFDDVFGPEACVSEKQMQDAYALVELVNVTDENTQVDFYGQVLVNLDVTYGRVIGQPMDTTIAGGIWGEDKWGQMRWGTGSGSNFGVIKIPCQNGVKGYLLQVAIKEVSTVPWVIIGFCAYVNFQKVGY